MMQSDPRLARKGKKKGEKRLESRPHGRHTFEPGEQLLKCLAGVAR